MGFRLAQSDLTLDDLDGSEIKVTLFDVKYAKNGKSYDVGLKEDHTECKFNGLYLLNQKRYT